MTGGPGVVTRIGEHALPSPVKACLSSRELSASAWPSVAARLAKTETARILWRLRQSTYRYPTAARIAVMACRPTSWVPQN